jgi:hypothetical protein
VLLDRIDDGDEQENEDREEHHLDPLTQRHGPKPAMCVSRAASVIGRLACSGGESGSKGWWRQLSIRGYAVRRLSTGRRSC